MKFITIFFLFVSGFGFSQTFRIVEFPWVEGQNVIFLRGTKPLFLENELKQTVFTPTDKQILRAEQIFLKQYNLARYKSNSRYNIIRKKKIKDPKFINNPQKSLRSYRRQYVGYINSENDTIIAIGIFNFGNKTLAKDISPQFFQEFIVGFDGYFENPNMINILSVNLSKGKLCDSAVYKKDMCDKKPETSREHFWEYILWKWKNQHIHIFDGIGWVNIVEIGDSIDYINKSLPVADTCDLNGSQFYFLASKNPGYKASSVYGIKCYDNLKIRVHLNQQKVFAIEFLSNVYITSKGIKKGNSVKKVISRYGKDYQCMLLYDNSLKSKKKQKIFIYYKKNGIGFLLNKKGKRVVAIVVFHNKK